MIATNRLHIHGLVHDHGPQQAHSMVTVMDVAIDTASTTAHMDAFIAEAGATSSTNVIEDRRAEYASAYSGQSLSYPYLWFTPCRLYLPLSLR